MQSVRPDAPWCPSNLEFIRRINGLDSIDEVYQKFFSASYLVMGLGDVYLGAPVATLNRHHSLFRQGRLEDSLAEHRAMMAALLARDARRVARLMKEHFEQGLEAAA